MRALVLVLLMGGCAFGQQGILFPDVARSEKFGGMTTYYDSFGNQIARAERQGPITNYYNNMGNQLGYSATFGGMTTFHNNMGNQFARTENWRGFPDLNPQNMNTQPFSNPRSSYRYDKPYKTKSSKSKRKPY